MVERVTAAAAMAKAMEAEQGLKAHNDLCAERYLNIHGRIDDVLATVRESRKASDAYREAQAAKAEREADRREKDRNWMRGMAVAIIAWLALQLYQTVTDRLDHATAAPPPAAVAQR